MAGLGTVKTQKKCYQGGIEHTERVIRGDWTVVVKAAESPCCRKYAQFFRTSADSTADIKERCSLILNKPLTQYLVNPRVVSAGKGSESNQFDVITIFSARKILMLAIFSR